LPSKQGFLSHGGISFVSEFCGPLKIAFTPATSRRLNTDPALVKGALLSSERTVQRKIKKLF
jgi:hypothetical protein